MDVDTIDKLCGLASSVDRFEVAVTLAGLIVVLGWIGWLKAASHEADEIVPMVCPTAR